MLIRFVSSISAGAEKRLSGVHCGKWSQGEALSIDQICWLETGNVLS
jgi:hypothetical protein